MAQRHDLDPMTELPLVQGFADVAPEAMRELASVVVPLRVASQDLAAEEGAVAPGLLFLVRGAVKAVRGTTGVCGHSTRVVDVMRASCVVPDASLFDGIPTSSGIVALRSSDFFVAEAGAIRDLVARHPSFERALFSRFVHASRRAIRRFDELSAASVEVRVRCLLDGLSADYGTPLGSGRFIALPLRRRDLASMVNATTETVSRLLAQLERDGQVRSSRDGIWIKAAKMKVPA